MKKSDRRRYEMLTRVREFGINYGHLLPESSESTQLLATVTAAIEEVHTREQVAASASIAMHRKAQAREALMDVLARVSQTARLLSAGNPELKPQFDLGEKFGGSPARHGRAAAARHRDGSCRRESSRAACRPRSSPTSRG